MPSHAFSSRCRRARARGYSVVNLGDRIEGEAREVARDHARLLATLKEKKRPVAVISGGALTVTGASGRASGGRNREYALTLAIALGRTWNVAALALDTDGIDGSPDAAGALVLPDTLAKAAALGMEPEKMLREHRSGVFFAATGCAVVTGPTRTNVGDLRVLLQRP